MHRTWSGCIKCMRRMPLWERVVWKVPLLSSRLETQDHNLAPALHIWCHYFAELAPAAYLAIKEKLEQSQRRPSWLGGGKAKAGCTQQCCASPGGPGATSTAAKAFAQPSMWKRGQWLKALWKPRLSWLISLGKQMELGPWTFILVLIPFSSHSCFSVSCLKEKQKERKAETNIPKIIC